ncbi:related to receptor-like protein kinase 5 precursor [Phialocephala subalpina]|uniref:Related to receptor-like protein kinase 5 n=1 Tax=Phialocephala subalpina TaxID=576137 RepID=A0A1L7X883_9HELO|nr:related to receptor-like protein kinase 5 precursor [Phialocephala subalpina]
MDQSTSPRPSGIPRPSRLPVPSLRAAPSRDNLKSSKLSINNPPLRSSASRDSLSSTHTKPRISSTTTRNRDSIVPRDRDASTGTVIHNPAPQTVRRKPSGDALFRKPSRPALRPVKPEVKEQQENPDENIGTVVEEEGQYDLPRRPRPSLSERTMETLQNIPSSPAVRNRRSSFFNSDSPMRPPSQSVSRPTSSAGSGSGSGSVSSFPIDFRASTNTFRPPQSSISAHTPLKRPSTAKSLKTPSTTRSTTTLADAPSKLPSNFGSSMRQRSPSPVKQPAANLPNIKSGSKTLSARPLKPRASMNGLFRKPSMPALDQASDIDRIGFVSEKKAATFSNSSSEAPSTVSKSSKAASTLTSISSEDAPTPRKSSLALRDQIAKAKAAKRAAAAKQVAPVEGNEEEVPVIPAGTFDFGLSDDPFNQQRNEDNFKGLLRKRIDAARTDGRLNIAGMGFKQIPDEVMNMYNLEAIGKGGSAWAESVDLTRFVAADNELELLSDDVFPDNDPQDNVDDGGEVKGNQFGGLETLDLHGNVLIALPRGLRRLELLTTLNISNNKLGNDCFEIVSQIPSLRDLKIAGNGLTGPLDPSITNLKNLESLDLQRNGLTSLPDSLAELVRLRVFNITENSFKSLPFENLRHLPLTELYAAKNNLTGTLVYSEVDELTHLQILDVTSNAITSLDNAGHLRLPALHQLSCSINRLTGLPDMSSWVSLLTLAAEDNNIASIPDGFVTLPKLRNVDFSGNNLRVLDDRIGRMASLDIFRISGNPLREKKFSGMTTEDLKRALKARLAPEPEEEGIDKEADGDGAFYSAPVSPISPRPSSSDWPVKFGGILDRSGTQSHSLNPVAAADVAANNAIKVLELHHNIFKEIPSSIAFFATTLTTLSISHNELTSDTFLKDDLELPALKELNLSSNTFNSLQPLIQHLKAPQLERLDISFNRLTSLPILKPYFPNLITLLASHNTIRELSPESIKGLRTVDCSSNEINSLNARIGLLGGPGGLVSLDVSGNRFRVPKYTILEKGTEATLAWLRDKIPAGEQSPSSTDVD